MTPQEFVSIRDDQEEIIELAHNTIGRAYQIAKKCKPVLDSLRPMTASDIKVGQIVWQAPGNEENEWYWQIIEEVLNPTDEFKAYVAEDGCRYGLCKDAWVEK